MPHAISDYHVRRLYQPVLHPGSDAGPALLYDLSSPEEAGEEGRCNALFLEIGDQVTTIGGVIGRVVAIKDDTFVLETGADRVKIRFTKSAISSVEKLNMDKAPADKK